MILRRQKLSDSQALFELEKKCFKSPWSLEAIQTTAERNNYYGVVCEVGDNIVGYAGCIFDDWDCDILSVATDPEFRRQGFAKKMLEDILQFVKLNGKERIFLEVRKSNQGAQALYLGLGFVPVGYRKNYYENTEDAIVMAKVLKGF